jgi:L-alanine-DL-glutamate epimerase-like enolase superfamily enzyme
VPHWLHDLHVHLVAAVTNARYVEYFPDDQVLNFRKLLDRQLLVKDGHLALPQTPGLGFEFDDGAIAKFAVNSAGNFASKGAPPWNVIQGI